MAQQQQAAGRKTAAVAAAPALGNAAGGKAASARAPAPERQSLGETLRRLPEFAAQVKAETAKVVWPSFRETRTTAIMVVVMTVILGLFFFGVDSLFSFIVRTLLKLVG